MTPQLVMFDLDGTLIDSRRGIEHSLRLTLKEFNVEMEEGHDFTWCIGSSLWTIFEHYLKTADVHTIDSAVAKYRHIYRDGPMFEYKVYQGVPEALVDLSALGSKIVVATAKTHEFAREVVSTTPFASVVAHVYGSEFDGTNVAKRDLIHHILKEENVEPDCVLMVGDRLHDVDGALANGVGTIGAAYGYGTRDELHRAVAIIDAAADLVECVQHLRLEPR